MWFYVAKSKRFTLKMPPKDAIYCTIPIKKYFYFLGKQGQTESNGSKQDQTGSNSAKQGTIGPNRTKQCKTVPNRANLIQMGPIWGLPGLTGAIRNQLGPVLPFIWVSILLLKSFRVRHIDWHLCSNFVSFIRFYGASLTPYCLTVTT